MIQTTYVEAGRVDPGTLGEHWVLVLGGVTRQGNRRARRAAARALKRGLDVVWFDGFDERSPDTGERLPLGLDETDGQLVVVGFQDAEADSFAGWLRASGKLQTNIVIRIIWKYFLRRVGSILRPRACWRAIRPDIETLSRRLPPPGFIIYGDDHSITGAWHAARIWADTKVSTTLPVESA